MFMRTVPELSRLEAQLVLVETFAEVMATASFLPEAVSRMNVISLPLPPPITTFLTPGGM